MKIKAIGTGAHLVPVCVTYARHTSLSNCQSFIYSRVKMKIESEKAQVCISSLSNYQSFVSGFV